MFGISLLFLVVHGLRSSLIHATKPTCGRRDKIYNTLSKNQMGVKGIIGVILGALLGIFSGFFVSFLVVALLGYVFGFSFEEAQSKILSLIYQ
jgi:uncharacterized membrane protein YfcA